MVSRENRPKTFESRAAGRTKSAVGVPANGDDGRHQKSLATGMDSAKMKRCPASKPREFLIKAQAKVRFLTTRLPSEYVHRRELAMHEWR